MNDRPDPNSTIDRLADPRTALILGTFAWAVATMVVIITGGDASDTLWTCIAGVAVGAAGYGLFLWQRWSARRGARGAQQGLL
ncbi:MAG: DUF2530 domain-containing protein [Rhodococcus sp.]|nr:DUF2530 domain-containing protein [Rhodococcus sp. (in: high G+C Gram-positive bacteria)]